MRDELCSIEQWALSNAHDAKMDALRFWLLKIPAIAASASSGVLAFYSFHQIALFMGMLAGVCITIDGIYPGGLLRNVHYRAYSELRNLEQEMVGKWRVGVLSGEEPSALAARIILEGRQERRRIAEYLMKIESSAFDHAPSAAVLSEIRKQATSATRASSGGVEPAP